MTHFDGGERIATNFVRLAHEITYKSEGEVLNLIETNLKFVA